MDSVNILLVDDHPANLLALEAVLNPLGHRVVMVSSGEEALDQVRNQDFAVILMDVNMPGMNGIETAAHIRAEERSKNTPIIFITAFDSTRMQIVEAYTAGGADYIVKPVVPDILQAKVSVFVELHRANVALKRQLAEIQQLQQLTKDREEQLSEEHSARTQAEAAQRRLAFLAEAGKVMASSLDYQITLTNLTELLVPAFADGCSIDMRDEQGVIHRLANRDVEPAKRGIFNALYEQYALNPAAPHGLQRVLQTGRPEFYPDVTDNLLKESALNNDQLDLMRSTNVCSIIITPLYIHNRVLGALTCVNMRSGRRYTEDDLALLEEIALRAASAIEHAALYQQAQNAIKERDEFLSVAAHELRTPITSLRGFSQRFMRQLDKSRPVSVESIYHAFSTMDLQSEKLGRLVSQLLDISRIQSGRLSIERQSVDIVQLMREIVSALQETTDQHRIMLATPETLTADVDPLRLEQVITNVLENAIKYSPQGGVIAVEMSLSPDKVVRIIITDQGMGIAEGHRPHLFERFYQAHPDRNLGGIGLGLYISREIIHLHGGTIEAEFPSEGGTRFVITFPATQQ